MEQWSAHDEEEEVEDGLAAVQNGLSCGDILMKIEELAHTVVLQVCDQRCPLYRFPDV